MGRWVIFLNVCGRQGGGRGGGELESDFTFPQKFILPFINKLAAVELL